VRGEAQVRCEQRRPRVVEHVEKAGLIAKTGDRFFQRSDQSEGLVDRFSCLVDVVTNQKAGPAIFFLLVFGVYSGTNS
jgi:hypothetical protein